MAQALRMPASEAKREVIAAVQRIGCDRSRSTTHPPPPTAGHAGRMPLATSVPSHAPSPSAVSPAAERGRDRAVDVARLVALVVVMFGHCALLLATIDTGGVRIGNLLGELPAHRSDHLGRPGHAAVLPRRRRRGRLWVAPRNAMGHLVVHSGAATVPTGVLVPGGMGGRSAGAADGARGGVGRRARARVRRPAVVPRGLPRRAGLRAGADPAADRPRGRDHAASPCWSPLAVDSVRIAIGTPEAGAANFLFVWLIPVVIGVAYARRLIRPAPAAAVAAAAFAAQVSLAAGRGPTRSRWS